MPSSRRHALVAAIATVLVACSGQGSQAPDDRDDVASPSAAASGATASPTPSAATTATEGAGNAEVLAFTAPDLEGGTFDASEYAGRDVILWMWAPW